MPFGFLARSRRRRRSVPAFQRIGTQRIPARSRRRRRSVPACPRRRESGGHGRLEGGRPQPGRTLASSAAA
jgi:hypothetical protein